MIVIDSSALRGVSFPHAAALTMLRMVGRHTDHPLGIPEVVLEEYLSYRRIDLRRKIKTAEQAQRDMLAVPEFPGQETWRATVLPDVATAIGSLKAELRDTFEVLPITQDAAIEALKREARRQPPASTDDDEPGGARDTAIWLAVVNVARLAAPAQVYFVTNDNDFGKHELLPELASEAPPNLVLCKGIDKVLEVLAKPADVSRDELERDLRTGNVKRAVQQSIAGAEVLAQISSSVPGMAGIVVASVGTEQITMLPIDLSRVHAYLLGGDRVVTAELRWQVVRRYAAATPGVDTTWGIRFNVISTVVMVLRPEDGAFRALHVPHRTVTSIIEEPLDGSAR